jgi:creatinine amidohydrolase
VSDARTQWDWERRTSDILRIWGANGLVAILPVAATEQHGPHLPVGTDSLLMDGMLDTLCEIAQGEARFCFLPVQRIGKSDEHGGSPGTLTLDAEVAIQSWTKIGQSVAETGFTKLAIISSHGGNNGVCGIVARAIRRNFSIEVGHAHWSSFGYPKGILSNEEQASGVHGGEIETSLMLHFFPDLVDMSRAENFQNRAHERSRDKLAGFCGPFSIAWLASDLNAAGVAGRSLDATPQKGRAIARHWATSLFQAMGEFRDL